MAYVLPLAQHSPFVVRSGHDTPDRSSCSAASIISNGTVQRHPDRSISTNSFSSTGPIFSPPLRRHATTDSICTPSARSTSTINLGLTKLRDGVSSQKRRSASQRTSLTSSVMSRRWRSRSLFESEPVPLTLVNVAEHSHKGIDGGMRSPRTSLDVPLPDSDSDQDQLEGVNPELHGEEEALGTAIVEAAASLRTPEVEKQSHQGPIFSRWVDKLRKQRHPPPHCVSARQERWTLDDFDCDPLPSRTRSARGKGRYTAGHHKSDSQNSSLRFITSIRSATATVASTSIATISRRTTKWRRGQQRSSIISGSDPRPSVDSVRSVIDEAARQRSRKRRDKLEELIRTEESYVADIKALSNVSVPD